jgi:hypothetical protein
VQLQNWAVVFLGICIVLAAILMHGRYRVISGSGARVYVVDQLTGETRLCLPNGCRTLSELVSTSPPLSPKTSTAPATDDGWIPVDDPELITRLEASEQPANGTGND